MRNATKLIKNVYFSKPELVLRTMPKDTAISSFADKYKKILTAMPEIKRFDEIQSHLKFPYGSFNSFPKETLTKIIEESFKIMKSKVETPKHTYLYNTVMINYLINEIDFDVKEFFREMAESGIEANRTTYGILIEIYSKCGEVEKIEKVIEKMNSEGIEIDLRYKMHLITGYIIAGQPDKADAIIRDNNLDENNKHVLIYRGRAYAFLGDTTQVIAIINKMKENNLDLIPSIYTFYRLLTASNVPESDLEQIVGLFPDEDSRTRIASLVCYLNRSGYFNKSLQFVEKYKTVLLNRETASYLLKSFNSKHCPTFVYESVLQLFSKHLDLSHRNLFSNMVYDEALAFSRTIINDENGNVILTSLLNKAISDRSVHSIKESLRFGVDYLRINKLNLQLQFGFIPAMLQSGMVSNCEELLKLLPEFQSKLIPPVLMYHLCKGNFSEYNHLISLNKMRKPLRYVCGNYPVGKEIIENIGFEEIGTLALEASKIFSPHSVNDILSSVITEFISHQSENRSLDCIAKIVKLTEKLNVTLNANHIARLNEKITNNAEISDLLRTLGKTVKSTNDNSEIDVKIGVE